MKKNKAADLITRLINNRISREELEMFLEGIDDEEITKEYEVQLKNHFEKIMEEYTSKKEKARKQSHPCK